jgi:hypothetical protein
VSTEVSYFVSQLHHVLFKNAWIDPRWVIIMTFLRSNDISSSNNNNNSLLIDVVNLASQGPTAEYRYKPETKFCSVATTDRMDLAITFFRWPRVA